MWFGGGIFNIFLLGSFFAPSRSTCPKRRASTAPRELRIYWQIMLPLAGPALAVVAIFTFINTWNDFLGPLIYLSSQD